MGLTIDPTDPRLGRGSDDSPVPQNDMYLVLSDEELGCGFVRPVRDTYRHNACGATTSLGRKLSETYARDPEFYGSTYCTHCHMHRPVSEFVWLDGVTVGC
jgi:hypothetical protein